MPIWTEDEWRSRQIDHVTAQEGFGAAGLLLKDWMNGMPRFDVPVDYEQVQRIAIGEDVPELDVDDSAEIPTKEPVKPRKRRRK